MNKQIVLEIMSEIQSTADNEPQDTLKDFLPLRNYQVINNPQRFLIIGGRGSGKTRLFNALLAEHGFSQLIGNQRELFHPQVENTFFYAGYSVNESYFPTSTVLSSYSNNVDSLAYWTGSLVYVIYHNYKHPYIESLLYKHFSNDFVEKLNSDYFLMQVKEWISYIKCHSELCEMFFYDVDKHLLNEDKWLFVLYDMLDRLCSNYNGLFPYIRSLLSYWFEHLNRWKRLKCKIFLRKDLYGSNQLNFPDSSKLKNNILALTWDTKSLYRLLLKRLANTGEKDAIEYIQLVNGLLQNNNEILGYIPSEDERLIKEFVTMMIGQYMGANSKKGVSYSWVPNHLQDAQGVLAPRSFLKCFSSAALHMLNSSDVDKLSDNRILSPTSIQGAIQVVSQDRVAELKEEYAWLESLGKALEGTTLLISVNDFIRKIESIKWSDDDLESLPSTSATEIFKVLEKLGIVYLAKDGRVNVPEIYLHGFGMKRKGGLSKPNTSDSVY